MRLQISGNELELILPGGFQIKEAENFIIKKADWIKKHLNRIKNKENEFILFGREIKVQQSFQLFIKKHRVSFKNDCLEILSPAGSVESLKKIFEAWQKHLAKKYIHERANELAVKYGFNIKKISIRSQKTRWGSASARRNLNFNFRLMRFRKEVIDYVIIHELCHLREMNHSKKFWLLVENICPGYRLLRNELKGKALV